MKKYRSFSVARYEPNKQFLGHCKEKIKEMQHRKQEWSDRKTHPNLAPWQ